MRFRHKLTIQRRARTQDDVGQVNEAWKTVDSVWGDIKPVSTREYFNASGERATITHKIRMWYGPELAPEDRIVYQSRIFDVTGVMNVGERNRQLEVMCTESM